MKHIFACQASPDVVVCGGYVLCGERTVHRPGAAAQGRTSAQCTGVLGFDPCKYTEPNKNITSMI